MGARGRGCGRGRRRRASRRCCSRGGPGRAGASGRRSGRCRASRARGGRSGAGAGGLAGDRLGEALHGARFEDGGDLDAAAELEVDRLGEADAREGVGAEIEEEIVGDADGVHADHLLAEARQRALAVVAREDGRRRALGSRRFAARGLDEGLDLRGRVHLAREAFGTARGDPPRSLRLPQRSASARRRRPRRRRSIPGCR